MYSYLKNTTVTANNNASYGIKFLDSDGNYTLNTRITNCILTANGNKMSDGIYFGGTSEIKNSALTANDNEASGINFDLDAAVTDSTLYADSNTKYGITSRYGTVDITDSFLSCIDEAAGLYHYGASNTDKTKYNPSPINILGTTVARLDSVRDIVKAPMAVLSFSAARYRVSGIKWIPQISLMLRPLTAVLIW